MRLSPCAYVLPREFAVSIYDVLANSLGFRACERHYGRSYRGSRRDNCCQSHPWEAFTAVFLYMGGRRSSRYQSSRFLLVARFLTTQRKWEVLVESLAVPGSTAERTCNIKYEWININTRSTPYSPIWELVVSIFHEPRPCASLKVSPNRRSTLCTCAYSCLEIIATCSTENGLDIVNPHKR